MVRAGVHSMWRKKLLEEWKFNRVKWKRGIKVGSRAAKLFGSKPIYQWKCASTCAINYRRSTGHFHKAVSTRALWAQRPSLVEFTRKSLPEKGSRQHSRPEQNFSSSSVLVRPRRTSLSLPSPSARTIMICLVDSRHNESDLLAAIHLLSLSVSSTTSDVWINIPARTLLASNCFLPRILNRLAALFIIFSLFLQGKDEWGGEHPGGASDFDYFVI